MGEQWAGRVGPLPPSPGGLETSNTSSKRQTIDNGRKQGRKCNVVPYVTRRKRARAAASAWGIFVALDSVAFSLAGLLVSRVVCP